MIIELVAINSYILAVYYCSDQFYRICIISARGKVLDFNDIFYCEKIAEREGRAIIGTITRSIS